MRVEVDLEKCTGHGICESIADDVFERTRQLLSARQIVEALQLVGFYWALGRMCTVLELELDHPAGSDSVQAVANLSG